MMLRMRADFDPQVYAADALQRRWEREGLTVSRARLADGMLRLSARGHSAVVAADGEVTEDRPGEPET